MFFGIGLCPCLSWLRLNCRHIFGKVSKQFGAVAQLGERLHGMEEVASSSLVSSTILQEKNPSLSKGFCFSGNVNSLIQVRHADHRGRV